jgi:GTP-binding protein Era
MKWGKADEVILDMIAGYKQMKFLVINKIDKYKDKSELLPFIKTLSESVDDMEIIPISARLGKNIDILEKLVAESLPASPALYSEEHSTNRNKRFFAAEYLREKLINRLGDEIPYRLAVTIDEFEEDKDIINIKATIWVEGNSQKNIVVGKGGNILKLAGEAARKDMEILYDKKVYLNTWVKVKKNWTQLDSSLELFGLIDNEI